MNRRTVKIYLKGGQVLTLRGVEKFDIKGGTVSWKVKTRGYKPLTIDPDEIAAVTYR